MDFKKWQNCLRIQIAPDKDQDLKLNQLVNHCKKHGFTDVMAMLNAEELCNGHITIEETKPWVELFKKERKLLLENGITFSVNGWIEAGHADRGWKLKEGQNYHTLVDFEGRKSVFTACFLDENFRKDYLEYVYYLVSELKPDIFWIEDDFRYHNHAPLRFPACFCELHMAEYNKRLNTSYTREQFVEKVMAKGKLTPERKVYLDVARDSLIDFAEEIGKTVKKANETTKVGLMSSQPGAHVMEGRDWDGLLSALSQGGVKINRIHLPYGEPSGTDWLYDMNRNGMAVRALTPKDAIVMPEYENGEPCVFDASPRFARFKLEASSVMSLKGMTYSIYGFTGNGVTEEFGYGDAIEETTPYLQGVEDLNFDFYSMDGVVIPIDPEAAYKKKIEKSFSDLNPKDYNIAANLSVMGICYEYSSEKSFKDKVVALMGRTLDCFTDLQLEQIFADNHVLVDGRAALELKERNLLRLIGASDAVLRPFDTGYQLYEATIGDIEMFGLPRYRGTCRWSAGDYVEITYDQQVKTLTKTYNEVGVERGSGMVEKDNKVLVIPYFYDEKNAGLTGAMRRELLVRFLDKAGKTSRCDRQAVSPYVYKENNRTVVMVLNSTVSTCPDVRLKLFETNFSRAWYVGRDGKLKPLSFRNENGYTIMEKSIEYLSSETFVLE